MLATCKHNSLPVVWQMCLLRVCLLLIENFQISNVFRRYTNMLWGGMISLTNCSVCFKPISLMNLLNQNLNLGHWCVMECNFAFINFDGALVKQLLDLCSSALMRRHREIYGKCPSHTICISVINIRISVATTRTPMCYRTMEWGRVEFHYDTRLILTI